MADHDRESIEDPFASDDDGEENGANEVLISDEDVSDGGVTDAEDS